MKHDLQKLKELNPIAPVIQEVTGYQFYPSDLSGHWLACVEDPELTIDQESGRWRRGQGGGDVINWLMEFYTWPFRKAADYLAARGGRPETERLAVQILKTQPEQAKVPSMVLADDLVTFWEESPEWIPGPVDPLEHIKDGRVIKALKLLQEVSRADLEDLILTGKTRSEHQTIHEFLAWVPQHFMPAFGYYEFCAGCYHDFDDWGEYYYAIDEQRGVSFEETYCPECVKKFQRWYQGRELLYSYLWSKRLIYPG